MNTPSLRPLLFVLLAAAGLPAVAQYKIVRPDGSVTYTDRPPADSTARITSLGRHAAAAGGVDTTLPLELRQPVAKYPVTLYTTADCVPCDNGRKLLLQRGIPFAERRVASEDDAQALERAVGGRSVPALNVGAQPLRGFSESDWSAILDVAGYPRESKLPRNWPLPVPTPLVERAQPAPAQARPAPPPAPPSEDEPATPPSTIRF